METMKSDMAGAAAVVAAILAIAELGLPVKVTGYLRLAENMPSSLGPAPRRRADDVRRQDRRGLNTDAEGRLVLADALVLAGEEKPDVIVDVATLTGAQVVALGKRIGGLMANDDAFRDTVARGGRRRRRGDVADAAARRAARRPGLARRRPHSTPASGTAACSRRRCSCGSSCPRARPWAHLDIAGPAFNEAGPYGYTPKGGTGFGVRTLVRLAETFTR